MRGNLDAFRSGRIRNGYSTAFGVRGKRGDGRGRERGGEKWKSEGKETSLTLWG